MTKKPRNIATVPEEELMFEAGVRVHEGAALKLEDGVDAFVWGDDVETCKEAVVCQSNNVFIGGEGLPEAGVHPCMGSESHPAVGTAALMDQTW